MAKERIPSHDLVIVDKDSFPILNNHPIDEVDSSAYQRVERLASRFLLRAPLTSVTRLANPGAIDMFSSDRDLKRGFRSNGRTKFEDAFINPLDLDCTRFDFAYSRIEMKPKLHGCNLNSNDDAVLGELVERGVFFVGRDQGGSGNEQKEDSCIESVCRHVRNAFAHGRIAVIREKDEDYLFLEDGKDPSGVDYDNEKPKYRKLEVRARALLKVSTLEQWYSILQEGEIPRGNNRTQMPLT